jgi:hypothetical protein
MAAVNVPGLEGLDGIFTEVSSGGEGFEWVTIDQRKVYTNAFIVKDGKVSVSESRHLYVMPDTDQFLQVLLGYKKRGFGVHKCDASFL